MEREEIGKVIHYFGKLQVAALKLSKALKAGDRIAIVGAHTELEQEVLSMQLDRNELSEARAGQEVAIKVNQKVREGDVVYKLIE